MKIKIIIMSFFVAVFFICYYQVSESEYKSEKVCKIDTVQVVYDYLLKYDDSCMAIMNGYMTATDSISMNFYGKKYDIFDAKLDSLIEHAERIISPNKFDIIMIKIIDNRFERWYNQ